MAKKRGNNEGSIYRMKNGNWRGQVSLDGRRLGTVKKTKREVQDWIRHTLGEIDKGLSYDITRITFGDYLFEWLTSKKSALRSTTWTHYDQLSRNHIIPRLGKIKIRALKPDHIQRLYNLLVTEEIGIPTIDKIHTVLHSALAHAVKTGLINSNPASFTIPPKAPTEEMRIFDETQISYFMLAVKEHRLEALFHLAVTTGMRQMELLGLKWTDLDWNRKTIKVDRQLVRPDGEGVQFLPPKTKFGKRTLDLGSKSIEVLRAHYEHHFAERKKAGAKWTEYGLIFTVSTGGPIHPRNLLRNYQNLLRDNGLPVIRFHDLRHTAASLMLNNGVPIIVVSRRLGHARPSITLDVYGHLMPSMQAEAAQLMDELITPIELDKIAPELSPVAPGCTRLHTD